MQIVQIEKPFMNIKGFFYEWLLYTLAFFVCNLKKMFSYCCILCSNITNVYLIIINQLEFINAYIGYIIRERQCTCTMYFYNVHQILIR